MALPQEAKDQADQVKSVNLPVPQPQPIIPAGAVQQALKMPPMVSQDTVMPKGPLEDSPWVPGTDNVQNVFAYATRQAAFGQELSDLFVDAARDLGKGDLEKGKSILRTLDFDENGNGGKGVVHRPGEEGYRNPPNTLAHVVAAHGHYAFIDNTLKQYGFDTSAKNPDGKTPNDLWQDWTKGVAPRHIIVEHTQPLQNPVFDIYAEAQANVLWKTTLSPEQVAEFQKIQILYQRDNTPEDHGRYAEALNALGKQSPEFRTSVIGQLLNYAAGGSNSKKLAGDIYAYIPEAYNIRFLGEKDRQNPVTFEQILKDGNIAHNPSHGSGAYSLNDSILPDPKAWGTIQALAADVRKKNDLSPSEYPSSAPTVPLTTPAADKSTSPAKPTPPRQ